MVVIQNTFYRAHMKLIALPMAAIVLLSACSSDHSAGKDTSAAATKLGSGLLLDHFDRNVRPQDDFYRFVNGTWLATTAIPADKSNYGMFAVLDDKSEANLRVIIESAAAAQAPAGSDTQRVGDFYASFMDEATVEAQGIKPLASEMARIDAIRTARDLSVAFGRMQRIGIAQPFAYFVSIDKKNASTNISYLYQNGLSMPDRDYYLSDDDKMKAARAAHRTYVRDVLAASGTKDAQVVADRVIALETRLAKAQWTRVQNRDATKTYNKLTVTDAQKDVSGIDWRAFFEGAASPNVDVVVVAQPSFFKEISAVAGQIPLAQWREYLRYQLLDSYAPYLNKQMAALNFEFHGHMLSGIAENKPRWKRGVDTVENNIGELAGKVYVERHFTADAKARAAQLVANMQAAYSQGIDQLQWMSAATKAQAHAKLAKFTAKIGFPDKWEDWSKLEVKRDDLIGNILRATAVAYDRDIAKLGQPVDRTEWHITPQTVNAYYSPPSNEIVFPAAILQPPFFNVAADDAVNYGAIGAVIGHEISHGFDDQGRQYDGDGNLNNWWTDEDDKEFRARTAMLVKQFSGFSPLPSQFVNGELTLGENIADVSGVAMAYRAYKLSLKGHEAPKLDGFTGEQRFFIGYAQVWARNYREDELRKRLLTDPHSPSEFRVNGIVANQPEFYAAFGLTAKDQLYREPQDRVKIW
jgi:endothelin-converting enzyme